MKKEAAETSQSVESSLFPKMLHKINNFVISIYGSILLRLLAEATTLHPVSFSSTTNRICKQQTSVHCDTLVGRRRRSSCWLVLLDIDRWVDATSLSAPRIALLERDRTCTENCLKETKSQPCEQACTCSWIAVHKPSDERRMDGETGFQWDVPCWHSAGRFWWWPPSLSSAQLSACAENRMTGHDRILLDCTKVAGSTHGQLDSWGQYQVDRVSLK